MRNVRNNLFLSLLVLSWALPVNAQVPVVDAAQEDGNSRTVRQGQSTPNSNNNNDIVINLYTQLEQLQREVQNLRGLVEEQSYQIRRMETEQRDRYLDLDRRLSVITAGAPSSDNAGATALSPAATGTGGSSQAANRPSPPPNGPGLGLDNANAQPATAVSQAPSSEQELYRTALSLLLEEEQYQQSITMFQQYIEVYPDGRNIANAYYWKGAALALESRLNEAISDFQTVINDYPQHQKAAGSMLKLGEAYNRLGDRAQARETWQTISTAYPDSLAEITLAQGYLQQLPPN